MVVGVEGSLQDPSREDDAVLSGHVVGINCRRSHTPSGGGQETRKGLGGGGEEERKEGEGEELICGVSKDELLTSCDVNQSCSSSTNTS